MSTRQMDIPKNDYEKIAKMITSDENPVGIDAKKTHVLILHKLAQLEQRLETIATQLLNR